MSNIDRFAISAALLLSGAGLTFGGLFWPGVTLELCSLFFLLSDRLSRRRPNESNSNIEPADQQEDEMTGRHKASSEMRAIEYLQQTIHRLQMERDYWKKASDANALGGTRLANESIRLSKELKQKERLMTLWMQHGVQSSHAWAKAAEQALAGDTAALNDRLQVHRDSVTNAMRLALSESFVTEFLLPESSILRAESTARAAPDMLAVLKAVEFVGERDLEDGYVPAACPFCQGEMHIGHAAECALAAAIAKAEGR